MKTNNVSLVNKAQNNTNNINNTLFDSPTRPIKLMKNKSLQTFELFKTSQKEAQRQTQLMKKYYQYM